MPTLSKIRASGQVGARRGPRAAVLPGAGVEHVVGVADVNKAVGVAGVKQDAGKDQKRKHDGQRAPVVRHGGDDTPKPRRRAPGAGRPTSEDLAYARKIGVSYGRVLRMGGAAKLKLLPEESLALLFKSLAPVPHTKGWSVRVRGMDVKAPHAVGEKFEAHLHELMVERGLVK